jgi:hypothetical protein
MIDNPEETPQGPLNPNALTLADASRMLTKLCGQAFPVEMFEDDQAAGAPANPDATINVVHLTAWAVNEMGYGD